MRVSISAIRQGRMEVCTVTPFPAAWLHRTDVPGGSDTGYSAAVAPPATNMKIKASLERILIAFDHAPYRQENDLDVEPETPVLQIPYIVLYPFSMSFRIGGITLYPLA